MEDENRESPIFVWWDIGSCPLPKGYDPLRVFDAIKSSMNGKGYYGPLEVEAVAIHKRISRDSILRFGATGIQTVPVDLCWEHNMDAQIHNRIYKWRTSHNTPGVVVVISCDRGHGELLRPLGESGFRTGIVYIPAFTSKRYLAMDEFHFSLIWSDVLDKGPGPQELDPRDYGF